MTFSVVVPTLNEQEHIRSCIRSVYRSEPDVELIVVDGGSRDHTPDIAAREGVVVLQARPGRGNQLNVGAASAHGEILLFLHADSRLSADAFHVLRSSFVQAAVHVGTCRLRFDDPHPLLRLYEMCARLESVLSTFGDQCIVVRRSFFRMLGGFPDWPLFEDVAFLQAARVRTRIHKFPTRVVTSARRFQANGIVRQQLRNARLLAGYLSGASIERLAASYYQSSNHQPKERSTVLCEDPIG